MQKKLLSTLVASAFAGAAGVAVAGPISTASVNTYATEIFPNGAASANVTLGNVAYTLTNPFAATSTQTAKLSLDGSTKFAACPAAPTFVPAVAGASFSAGTLSSDGTTCTYTITVGATPVAASTTVSIISQSADKTSVTALGTGGGVINETVAIYDNGGTLVESNTAAVARSAEAMAMSVASSSSFTTATDGYAAEASKIDVTAPTPVTLFTNPTDLTNSTTVINLGRVRYSQNSGLQVDIDGTTSVDLTTTTTQKLSLTVTGTFATNSTIKLDDNSDCSSPTVATATISGTTATFSNVDITGVAIAGNNKDVFVCYTVPGNKAISAAQFAVSAGTVTQATALSATMANESATGNLYNLKLNGIQIDIRNHIPSSVTGWTNAYRIINTGAVAASFSAQYIGVDGTVGSSGVIAANVPSGGTVVVSVPQVEAAIGAAPAGAPAGVGPRLRITAPTDSARVQVYGVQPGGNIFTNTDAMGADSGGTDQ